jgi:outer membrane protein OmpA-like peptidoglycan-associated protein
MKRRISYRLVAAGLSCLTMLSFSGCMVSKMSRVDCRVASALAAGAAGAAVGAVAVDQIDSSPDGIGIASGAVVGFVVAGLTGYGVSAWTCPAEAEPPAPPPPPPAPTPVAKERLVLRGVTFDFDKATLRADARPVLDEAARALAGRPTTRISVEGHTDAKGSEAYNMRLSERRAQAVVDYLVKAGIAGDRLEAHGFGESRPIADNDTEDGRARNRRVELRVLGE